MRIAITRDVSPALARCELTHLPRKPIDVGLAVAQHEQYRRRLTELGCIVRCLPAAADLPDSIFVEDAAIVLDEIAILTRPGAASRRAEVGAVAEELREFRPLVSIEPPATLDGGDVMRIDRTLYVGRSRRSNEDASEQLSRLLAPHGYSIVSVAVRGCLHLKSAVTRVAERLLLANPAWIDVDAFAGIERVDVDPAEPFAANALWLDPGLIYAEAFPATRRRLEQRGVEIRSVDVSEIARAEGGVTCCSVMVDS